MAEDGRKSDVYIEAFGKKGTMSEFAKEYGISLVTLRKRIKDLKWPAEKALSEKVRKFVKRDDLR